MKILKRLLLLIILIIMFPFFIISAIITPIALLIGAIIWVLTGNSLDDIALAPIEFVVDIYSYLENRLNN
jgi:hypothetical protein